jgi:hypothetical protein
MAQESSFGAFIASPVGDFKSTSLEDGGFAKQGWGIVFDSRSKLTKSFSLYFHSTYQWNEMDTDVLEAKFTEYLGYRTTVSDSKYSPLLTTIGPAYDYKVSEKFRIGLNGTIGIMFNNTKAFTIKVYDENNNLLANELVNFDGNVAFAYTFGTEFVYDLIPQKLGISLYADYTSATQKSEISSPNLDAYDSFQKLQYFDMGIKLVMVR